MRIDGSTTSGRPVRPRRPVRAAAPSSPGDRLTLSRAVYELRPEGPAGFRTVERDVADAFYPLASPERARLEPRAARQIASDAAAEAAAARGLREGDAARYQRLATLLAPLPLARLALQQLLLDGRLPGERRNVEGETLLAALDRLERAPLLPALDRDGQGARLDRAYLLGGLVQELAFPSCISQKGKATCAVTMAQILLARHHPAEYVRLVTGLASPAGEVRLASGEPMRRVPGTEVWGSCGRTPSARLWQPAMMDFGNGAARYDDVADLSHGGGEPWAGLGQLQINRVIAALTGTQARAWERVPGTTAEELLRAAEASLAAGLPVPTSLRWGVKGPGGRTDSYHAVLVTAIDATGVGYLNPWGTEERMSREAFLARLEGLSVIHPDWAFPRPPVVSFAPGGRVGAASNCITRADGRKACL